MLLRAMDLLNRLIGTVRRDIGSLRDRNSFARNALYTFSDAAVNIGSQLILTPVIARIYGPAAYGVYGLFTSITSSMASLGTLGYTAAFVLPREERDFLALFRAAGTLLIGLAVLSLPLFLFPSVLYAVFPSFSVMGSWCMLVPWMTVVLGGTQMMAAWVMRAKDFAFFAKVGPSTTLGLRGLNLVLGLLNKGASWGLLVGDLVVRSAAAVWYVLHLRRFGLARLFQRGERAPVVATALAYRHYPLFNFPAQWLTELSLSLPVYALTALNDPTAVGRFTLAGSLLLMPLRLFGYSLSSVFIRKATDLQRDDPAALALFVQRMYVRFRFIGLLPFIGLMFFGDVIFRLVLGGEWTVAGAYCGVMGPFYLFRLLSEPVASIYNAKRQERALFLFGASLFTANVLGLAAAYHWAGTPVAIIATFAGINALAYLYQSASILARAGAAWARLTFNTVIAVLATATLLATLRLLLLGSWWPALY